MSVYVCSRRSVVGRPRSATHTRLRAVEIWPAQTTTAAFVWSVLRNASVFRHVPLTIDTDWLMPSKPTQPYGNGAWILQWIVVIKSCFQNTSVFRSLVCLIAATSSTLQFSPEFNPSWSCYPRWRLAAVPYSLRSPIFPGTTITDAVRFIEAVRPLVNHQTSSGERMRSRSLSLHWNIAVINSFKPIHFHCLDWNSCIILRALRLSTGN